MWWEKTRDQESVRAMTALSGCGGRVHGGPVAGLVAGLALALAGCGGGSAAPQVPTAATGRSSGPASPEASTAALQGSSAEIAAYVAAQRKWVACMHDHGVDLPDPEANGVVNLKSFKKNEPASRKAWLECQPALVAMPESVQRLIQPKLTEEQKAVKRRYASCMQANGAPDFPDPGTDGHFQSRAWTQTSVGAQRATRACASIIGDPVDAGSGVG